MMVVAKIKLQLYLKVSVELFPLVFFLLLRQHVLFCIALDLVDTSSENRRWQYLHGIIS
jgi:hypothetical protein